MPETAALYRDVVTRSLYKALLKPAFFRTDPESLHDRMIRFGSFLGRHASMRAITAAAFGYENDRLRQNILGIDFGNPVGLAAGFDKNAELTRILPSVGFGFAEVGSITGERCEGNPKPRLWRLPKSKSLNVYYGLKNDGCEAISARLNGRYFDIPIGANVAMTNCKENMDVEKAIADFSKAFKVMEPVGDYVTVNISCPNAAGGQPFMEADKANRLLTALDSIHTGKPVFIKLSPDMSVRGLDGLLDVLRDHRVHGIICSNLTKKKAGPNVLDADVPKEGGLSGKAVQEMSDAMLAHIYRREGKRFVLVGCGGIFNAEDAYKKIRLGASLLQMITGMIYEGPQVIGEINRGLAALLKRDGFAHMSQAVGADNANMVI